MSKEVYTLVREICVSRQSPCTGCKGHVGRATTRMLDEYDKGTHSFLSAFLRVQYPEVRRKAAVAK